VVDQRQRDEGQHGASFALWLRQTIDDRVFVDLFDPLMGERRAYAVAQQPFQSGPVLSGDAHRDVERETAIGPQG
jgi:hypothetical protein